MLVWSDVHGWSIAVETAPFETPVVLAHLGHPVVPPPREVARFVADVLAGGSGGTEPTAKGNRQALAVRLRPYAD
nr:hypothetical protein GCM10017745_65620 [Saccharothrix mutabilis subsp. capreolus]